MKSAAIATTLLLHVAAIGAFVHLYSGQGTTQSKLQPFTIALVSTNSGETAEKPPATVKPLIKPTASEQKFKSQEVFDTADTKTSPQAASSNLTVAPATSGKTSVSIPASYADSNRKPVYPLLSRRQEEQGTVLLRIMVKADGTAGEIHVRKTSGYPLLDESALNAVQNWRFTPASVNNKPIAEWYQIAIPFKLHN